MDKQSAAPARPSFAATGTARYEEALAGIDDHFVILDRELRYVFINARAAEILGRPAEELVGRRIWDLFPEGMGNQLYQELQRALTEGVSIHSEHHHPPHDGWYVNHIYPYASGICVFTTDISELKRAQQERERLFALLETVARQMPAAVMIAEPGGELVFCNEQVSRIVGFTYPLRVQLTDATDRELLQGFRPDGRLLGTADWPLIRALRDGEVVHNEEIVLLRVDGSRVVIEANAAPVRDRGGEIVAAVVVFQDVTQRKQDEEELLEADRRKDEFLAMLAHELRNPLAPILHAVHILRQVEPATGEEARCEEVIERQTLHLSRLVDDLLDISRITRGKVTLQRQPVELAVIVARAVETVKPFLEARHHELAMALPPEPVVLAGDLVRLAQILANLLHNAGKYTQDGGRIELAAELRGGETVLRVRDNGIGIPPEMLPRVFDLFMQADRSLSRSEGGLGVGLTLVRSLVEMHGGSVEARSDGPDRGTEIVVRLPLWAEPAPAGQAAPVGSGLAVDLAPEPPRAARRILVVDDNRDSAESLAMLLELRGHEVQVALDGRSALSAARAFEPDVILLDIGLPGMDGYEVARRLREEGSVSRLVALTGYGQEEDRRRSREAGFDHHLVKPVDLETLALVLTP